LLEGTVADAGGDDALTLWTRLGVADASRIPDLEVADVVSLRPASFGTSQA